MSMVRRVSLPGAINNGSSRREGLRTKTPSVNELSKKFKNTPKGKRRLEFQTKQPLKDKKFYLDLYGYKKILSLSTRIIELGGKVEEFFSKDISYLITNRKDADSRLSPRSNSTPSPGMSIPSPFPINKSSSIRGSAWQSPLSADSPQSIDAHQTVPKHDTRGKTLRKQATLSSTNKFGTSDILTNARTWGINVIHLEKILEKLAEYGPSRVEKQPSIKELMGSGKKELRVKIRKLQVPFIKVEDQSRYYKPLVKEFKEWPLPNFDSPVGTCPFDSPKKKKEPEQKNKNKGKDNQDVKKQAKKGYCECCCMHYDTLDSHLKSDHHKEFAQNDTNYDSLDQLIREGPSLRVFLDKIKQSHSSRSENPKPSSDNKLHDPFHTPTKEPMNLMEDTIDKENTKEELVEESNKITRQDNENEDDVEVKTPDNKHSGRGESSQGNKTTEQDACEGSQKRRLTRSLLSIDVNNGRNTELDVEGRKIKPSMQNVSFNKKTSILLSNTNYENNECQVELKHFNLADVADVPTQKTANSSDEKKDKQNDGNKSQDSLSLQEPTKAISSITHLKSHKTTDCDEHKENKRVLRSQRKSNCSSDSTETLTSLETLTHSPPKRNYRVSNVSSTDSLPEVGIKANDSQKNNHKDGMLNDNPKVCRSKQHEFTETNTHKVQGVGRTKKESIGSDYEEIKEDFYSPKNGLNNKICDSVHHNTLTTEDEEEDSDASTKAEAGSSRFIPKLVTPYSIWSKLPGDNPGKEIQIPSDTRDEASNGNDNTHTTEEDNKRRHSEAAQGSNDIIRRNDDTFTSLFDSDEDDDKSFLGFDVPQFALLSSEPGLTYHIKKIVEYFTESQDDTLVNTTNDDVDDEGVQNDEEESSKPTEGSETQMRNEKRQPHGIRIILSSTAEDGDDDVFKDEEEEEEEEMEMEKENDDDYDYDGEDSDNDGSSSTVADSTDGEDEELLTSSSALCMDYFTHKRKSSNMDTSELDIQLPPKRRRTTNDEDSSTYLSEDRERTSDQDGCGVLTRRSIRASTRASYVISIEDDSQEGCVRETRRKTRASTRVYNSRKEIANHMDDPSQKEHNKNTRSETRATTRKSKTEGKGADDDCAVHIDEASEKDRNTKAKCRTRATRISNTVERKLDPEDDDVFTAEEGGKRVTRRKTGASKRTLRNKENLADDVKHTSAGVREGRSSTRGSKRTSRIKENISDDDQDTSAGVRETRSSIRGSKRTSRIKEHISDDDQDTSAGVRETRSSTRGSKRTSRIKEHISDDDQDTSAGVRETRSSNRTSTSMSNTNVVDHEEGFVPEYPSLKRVTRSREDQTIDITNEKNNEIENNSGKENTKHRSADNEISPNKKKYEYLTNNDSLSSVFGDTSCNSYSSFFKDLPPELVKSLSVHITIEEKVKLRTRNRIISEATPTCRISTNERRLGDQKIKDDTHMVIDDPSKSKPMEKNSCLTERIPERDEIMTHSTNMAEVGNHTRFRSRSLNQGKENSKYLSSKNPNKAMSSVEVSFTSPFQRKALCSAPSSRDSSPITTPVRMHRHWIFDPGHFSSASTPQPSRKVKSRTSPSVDNQLVTTRKLRNRNKCLMAGDSYEFIDEDVYTFDD